MDGKMSGCLLDWRPQSFYAPPVRGSVICLPVGGTRTWDTDFWKEAPPWDLGEEEGGG